jgi:hypothetical protein
MGHLIDDLLIFSRMGRQDIGEARIDMMSMVNDVLKDLPLQYDISE